MVERLDPTRQFYLVNTIGNCDGTTEFGGAMTEGVFFSESDAIKCMKDNANCDADLECVIYRVTPIRRSVRHYKYEAITKPKTGVADEMDDK